MGREHPPEHDEAQPIAQHVVVLHAADRVRQLEHDVPRAGHQLRVHRSSQRCRQPITHEAEHLAPGDGSQRELEAGVPVDAPLGGHCSHQRSSMSSSSLQPWPLGLAAPRPAPVPRGRGDGRPPTRTSRRRAAISLRMSISHQGTPTGQVSPGQRILGPRREDAGLDATPEDAQSLLQDRSAHPRGTGPAPPRLSGMRAQALGAPSDVGWLAPRLETAHGGSPCASTPRKRRAAAPRHRGPEGRGCDAE